MGVDRRAESGSRKAPKRTGGQKEIAALVGTTRRQRPSCLILVRRLGRLNFRRTCLIRCRTSLRSLWGAATPRVALPRYPTNGSAYKYNTGNHLFPRGSRMIASSGYRAVGPWQRSLVHAGWRARRFEQLRLYSEAESLSSSAASSCRVSGVRCVRRSTWRARSHRNGKAGEESCRSTCSRRRLASHQRPRCYAQTVTRRCGLCGTALKLSGRDPEKDRLHHSRTHSRREWPAGWDSGQERAMVPFCL